MSAASEGASLAPPAATGPLDLLPAGASEVPRLVASRRRELRAGCRVGLSACFRLRGFSPIPAV